MPWIFERALLSCKAKPPPYINARAGVPQMGKPWPILALTKRDLISNCRFWAVGAVSSP